MTAAQKCSEIQFRTLIFSMSSSEVYWWWTLHQKYLPQLDVQLKTWQSSYLLNIWFSFQQDFRKEKNSQGFDTWVGLKKFVPINFPPTKKGAQKSKKYKWQYLRNTPYKIWTFLNNFWEIHFRKFTSWSNKTQSGFSGHLNSCIDNACISFSGAWSSCRRAGSSSSGQKAPVRQEPYIWKTGAHKEVKFSTNENDQTP